MPLPHDKTPAAAPPGGRQQLARRFALASGGLSALVGAIVLTGWWLGYSEVATLGTGTVPMVANTALMAVLGGGALLALVPSERPRWRSVAGRLLASAACVVAAVTLLEYALSTDAAAFDLLLAAHQEHPELVRYPGRPSPHTALSFGLLGLALLFLDRPSPRRLGAVEVLTTLGLALPIVALVGYAFDVEALYGVPGLLPYTGMALNTTVALLLLGVGVVASRPRRGPMRVVTSDGPGGMAARRMLLGMAALPLLAAVLHLGVVLGLYTAPIAASLVVLMVFVVLGGFVFGTAKRLDRADELARAGEEIRARTAALVESSGDAIIALTPDAVVTAWNPAAERIYGYHASEMIGRSIFETVPEADVPGARVVMQRILRGERVGTLEVERLRKDGSRVPLSLTVSPVFGPDGGVEGLSVIARDIRERLADRAALRESEARTRQLFERAPDGIFLADLDGRYQEVNEAGQRLLGYERDEIVGKTIMDLIPPEDVDRLMAAREVMQQGRAHVGEWRLRRSDGSYVPVEVSSGILPDGRWQGYVRDISARKVAEGARDAAEAELREAHARERSLRRELGWVMEAGGAVADAMAALPEDNTQNVLTVLGLQARTLTGAELAAVGVGGDTDRPFEHWIHSGVDESVARAIGRKPRARGVLAIPALEGGVVRVADVHQHPAFAGLPEHHPALTSVLAVPILFRGRPVGNLYLANKRGGSAFTEQDERVVRMLAARAGAAVETARLYESESLQRVWLQSIFDQMPEGVVIVDTAGHVRQANQTGSDHLGSEAGHVLPPRFRDASGVPLPPSEQPVARVLEGGETLVGVELALCDGDELLPVLVSATPVRTRGRSDGAVLVFQDVRQLKELERLREEWGSVVAHDLRQPISVINMAVQLLARAGPMEEQQAAVLQRVRDAARRLERMVGDLADVSRIEARQLTLRRRVVDLGELVVSCVDETRAQLPGHEVRLDAEPAVTACVDADRIRQVLTNLLSNAGKYGDAGTPIDVELRRVDGEARFVVTNRGPGIGADELPFLFSRFARTPAARAGGKPGVGLGLYICRGLVEAHGGRVWAESTPGGTTSFHAALPLGPCDGG